MIAVQVDQQQLTALLTRLQQVPKALATASNRAINKSLTSVRAEMVRLIRTDYAIKAGDVRKSLEFRRSTVGTLRGSVFGESSPGVPLERFAKMRRNPSTRRTKSGGYTPRIGIPVQVRKDRSKTVVRGAFLATMSSGHKGAFIRGSSWKASKKGSRSKAGKQEIVELYGPTPVKLLEAKKNSERVEQFAGVIFNKNMVHEAEFVLSKQGQ